MFMTFVPGSQVTGFSWSGFVVRHLSPRTGYTVGPEVVMAPRKAGLGRSCQTCYDVVIPHPP